VELTFLPTGHYFVADANRILRSVIHGSYFLDCISFVSLASMFQWSRLDSRISTCFFERSN